VGIFDQPGGNEFLNRPWDSAEGLLQGTHPMIKNLTGTWDFNNRIYQKARFGYSPHEPFPSPPAYRQAGGEGR